MRVTRKDDKRVATRARIIKEARALFGRRGYMGTSLADVVRASEVTTGAVYHHFGDKKGLFQAVAESVEQSILDHVIGSVRSADPIEALGEGVEATLDYCADPEVQRIAFMDAPTVIGQSEWREVEFKYAFGLMVGALKDIVEKHPGAVDDVDMTASVLLAGLIQLAHNVAEAEDAAEALETARLMIRSIFQTLVRAPVK